MLQNYLKLSDAVWSPDAVASNDSFINDDQTSLFCPQFSYIFRLIPTTSHYYDGHCVDKFEATVSFVVLLQRTVQFATSVLLIAAAQTGS